MVYPASSDEVRVVLDYGRQNRVNLIPYGGGTSVVGHINPFLNDIPCLTVDLSHLNGLLALDEKSRLATFGAGITGPALEAALQARGYTLGHFPQSFDYSTLGGWIATRSSGQQSLHYGRIEALLAGAEVETPAGRLRLPPLPASAAGPDLRQAILGSEGRLGIITEATVRVRLLPAVEAFYAAFFRHWTEGVAAVRAMVQAGVPLSMLRLSDAAETEVTLQLAGKERLVTWAGRGLNWLRYGDERCLLLYGVTGEGRMAKLARRQSAGTIRAYGGLPTGAFLGRMWARNRFRHPYLRNSLWEKGYAIDTLETALPWSEVEPAAAAVKEAIATAPTGEQPLVFAHLSHVYPDGASIYVTYLFRRAAEPSETWRRWHLMKRAASEAILAHRGTISHQHGVGLDHAAYLSQEKGSLGLSLLQSLCRAVDPDGMMNPGKLLADAEEI